MSETLGLQYNLTRKTSTHPALQIKPLVSSRVAKALIQEKKFKVVQRNIIEEFVSANVVSAVDIQEVMDSSGVSSKGYTAIQRSVSQALVAALVTKGIKKRMLPKPSHIWKLRSELNSKQFDYFGPPFQFVAFGF